MAERMNRIALEEIFGLGSARVAAGGASSLEPAKSRPAAAPVPAPEGVQLGPPSAVPEVALPSAPLPASDPEGAQGGSPSPVPHY